MLELGARLLDVVRSGRRIGVATGIDVVGSAPHPAGTSMAVTDDGMVLGSVSAGCVEADALTACQDLLRGGGPQVLRFGFGDAAAARAGLSCGGELDVLVHSVGGAALEHELRAAADGRAAAIGLVVAGPADALGTLIAAGDGAGLEADLQALGISDTDLERLRASVAARAGTGRNGFVELVCGRDLLRVFVDTVVPAARLVIAGATETAVALAAAGTAAGWSVTVCDHRPAFADADRFPAGTEVVVARPHEYLATTPLDDRTAVCLLGHDEDLDPLAVIAALERGAGYVGALGSRSTTQRRRERLRVLGLPDAVAERLHAPIGLDVGAATPAETAISILAEVLADRSGRSGRRLSRTEGSIHRRVAPTWSAVQQPPDPVAGHGQLHRT